MTAPAKTVAVKKFRQPLPIAGTTAARQAAEDQFIAAAELPQAAPVAPPETPAAMPAKPAARKKAAKPATPQAAEVAPAAKEKPHVPPWQHADRKVAKHVNLKFDGVTHAKMKWIVDNVPRMKSHQKLVEACLFDFIDKLLAEHYKPSEKK
jgi:hypothetical protein